MRVRPSALERAVGADEPRDEVVGRGGQELPRRRVLGQVAALAQDRDPVAHLDRLVDVVGDEHDRLADLVLEAQELVLEALAVDRVDRAERLVHQHQRRVGGQRAGDADALALAARQLGRVAARDAVDLLETDEPEQLVDARRDPGPLPAQQPGDGRDVVGDRQVREQADLLDDVADLAPQVGRVAIEHRAAVEQDVAAGRVDHAVDQPHRRRLAAARRPDEHADLAGRDGQRQVLDRGRRGARVALGHVAQLELGRTGPPAIRQRRRPLRLGGVRTHEDLTSL